MQLRAFCSFCLPGLSKDTVIPVHHEVILEVSSFFQVVELVLNSERESMRNSFKALLRASNPNTPLGTQPDLTERVSFKTAQLRWLILLPVMVVIFIMIGTLIAAVYRNVNAEISREINILHTTSNEIYQDNLEHLSGMLAGITGTMALNAELRSTLTKKDREKLSKLVAPIFATLQKEYEISHFYLIGPDRTVLLRAHNPEVFGDVINRTTTLDAQLTKAPAHGVEFGIRGELVLRFVRPLYRDAAKQHLVGFIELGVDTNHLLKDMQKALGIQMFEFLSKEFLTRDVWQLGMPDTASSTDWDHFANVAPSAQVLKNMTPEMSSIIATGVFPSSENIMEISQGKSEFRAISFPVMDIRERKAGSIVMLVDVTSQVLNARNTLYLGLILGLVGGGLLFAFFWLLTGRIGRLIEQHQDTLHHLATRDGLTGLFNHITFYTMLDDEISRSQRSGTPVSLLMLDLDHFKDINDQFGHVSGDVVLKEFGKIIHRLSRSIDKVCRYGGEEIAVILPETNSANAMIAAERMRAAVEEHLFKPNEGQNISISASIGVATVTENATSAQELVIIADQALYIAKQRGRNQVYQHYS